MPIDESEGDDRQVRYRFPYLRKPVLAHPSGRVLLGHTTERHVDPSNLELIERLSHDALDLDALAAWVAEERANVSVDVAKERLLAAAELRENVFKVLSLELPANLDGIFVCQGYGGVYIHTIEVWKRLSQDYNILLVAPVEPPYGHPTELDDRMLICERLEKEYEGFSYFNWVCLVRALVNTVPHDLLYLEHRSQSLYLFDLMNSPRSGSVIHDDGFYDNVYYGSVAANIRPSEGLRQTILKELLHSTRYNEAGFYGLYGNPGNNRRYMEAGWLALRDATENWQWSQPNFDMMSSYYHSADTTMRLVLPMIDTSLRREGIDYDPNVVLFTTTMHNILKKGIVQLLRAMRHVPEPIRVRAILGQPDHLPARIAKSTERMDLGGKVAKEELVELYHRCAVYCRVSRDESSPLSILEAMACGLPVIVSTVIAANTPLIEDGVTGFVVSPSASPQVLAGCITQICNDYELRQRMSRACIERAAEVGMDAQLPLLTRYMETARGR